MSERDDGGTGDAELLQLTVDVWHPDCWTLAATNDTDGGLLGYGVTRFPESTGRIGYYTAFGESRRDVAALVDSIRASDRIDDAIDHAPGPAVAPVSRNVVVSTSRSGGMRDAFRSRGYLHLGPTSHRDGRERRTLLTRATRQSVRDELATVESAFDADLDLRRVTSIDSPSTGRPDPATRLSVRQREAFALARERGYYAYPREVDAAALADDLGVSTSTLLEHLRKAEAKLLADVPIR